MATVIRMPEVLTGATEAALQSWLVAVGDEIAVGQPLAEVETEKATVEYEAESAGTVAGLLIETGVQVNVGTPIAVLADAGESIDDALASADSGGADNAGAQPTSDGVDAPVGATAAAPAASPVPVTPASALADGGRVFMSPLERRLVAERGLDLADVTGSGPGGRIVRRDLNGLETRPQTAAVADGKPEPRTAAPTRTGDDGYDLIPHTGMRSAIARRLTESKNTIPHFYLVADCHVDALLELRASVNGHLPVKASLNDFIVKAVAAAFGDVPEANVIWTDDGTRRYHDVDIAIAVAIDGGLVTPVVRAVNRRSLSDVGASIRDLAERGREGKLKQDELEGGSFAVSNLGMYGTEEFSAILNPPQSGILAVGAARRVPIVINDELAVGTVMTVTLSADHRVLDGALAAQWLAAFVAHVENPVSILL